jgi:hypothetical protein
MSTNPNEATNGNGNESKQPKALTVADDMDSRRVFPTVDAAQQYLAASAERFTDFGNVFVAAPGVGQDEEGNPVWDEEIYTPQMDVMVAVLRKQGKGVKAIVVAPVPKVNVLMESDAGKSWVEKILHKELNHVAVRHLRDAEDPGSFVDQMPTTVDGYITSERGTGGIMETFDLLYKGIDAALSQKLPVWSKARFIKSELRRLLSRKATPLSFTRLLRTTRVSPCSRQRLISESAQPSGRVWTRRSSSAGKTPGTRRRTTLARTRTKRN